MRLRLKERYAVIKQLAVRYQNSNKKQKGNILDEFISLTKYNRKYAIHVLSKWGKNKIGKIDGKNVEIIAEKTKRRKYKRAPLYDGKVKAALIKIWIVYGFICSKRLKAVLEHQYEILHGCNAFSFSKKVWTRLKTISASTIDRLLRKEKLKSGFKGHSYTQPGTLLKHQIPIRTGTEWNEQKPGYFEIDLVGHEGGNASGEFAYSLNVTDVKTGWTEPFAVKNKARKWVFEGLMEVKQRMPIKILGIDSDNGSEFINNHLYNYCKEENIVFTRSRPIRKNDNCFIEQKNYTVVRKYAGYFRYDTEEEVQLLNELYRSVRVLNNFFLPSMKLIEKVRVGSKIEKKYDTPKTPYQRLLESEVLDKKERENIQQIFLSLDPVTIHRQIVKLQDRLEKIGARKQRQRHITDEKRAL